MARIFTGDAAAEHLQVEAAVVPGYPLSVSAWVSPDNSTVNHTLFWLGDPAVAAHFHAVDLGSADAARAFAFAGGTAAIASSTTTYNVGAWNHVGAVFASAIDRAVFLNGAGKGTNATSRTPAGLARTCLGRRADSTPSDPLVGKQGPTAVWDIALSDAEMAQLAAGASPTTIQPDHLVAYWPILGAESPEPDEAGASDLTVTGTLTQTDGPPLGVVYTQLVQGTLAMAGALRRQTTRALSGAVTVSGSLAASVLGALADVVKLLAESLGLKRSRMLFASVSRSSMLSVSLEVVIPI